MVACITSRCGPGFASVRDGRSTRRFDHNSVSRNAEPNDFTIAELGDQRVGFGKHCDLTFAELCDQYPDYVHWLQGSEEPSPQVASIIEYAAAVGVERPPAMDEATTDWNTLHMWPLNFGKYEGTLYKDIYE